MDLFTDHDSALFLDKEWLSKVDYANSRSYLFKFHASPPGDPLRSCFLISDTRNVWFEALDTRHLAQRWRRLNADSQPPHESDAAEHAWRVRMHARLSMMHTMKAILQCVFSIESARDADLAVELRTCDPMYNWRWECYALGPTTSAELLSTHLILPLLSITHLAFSSADPLSELTMHDLEQAVDRVAQTGRRARDVHARQTLARPRMATALRRMTAMFHFADHLPPIIAELDEDEDIDAGLLSPACHAPGQPAEGQPPARAPARPASRGQPGSATESASEEEQQQRGDGGSAGAHHPAPSLSAATRHPSTPPPHAPGLSRDQPSRAGSSSATPSPPPLKKKKRLGRDVQAGVEEETEAGAGEGARDGDGRGAGDAVVRSRAVAVRQPLKRGGRRF